jgi:hypothetical protein
MVLIGDRGMIAQARLEETVKPGLDWITALRAPAMQGIAEARAIELSLFDQRDLAEITTPDYPAEHLLARYAIIREMEIRDEYGEPLQYIIQHVVRECRLPRLGIHIRERGSRYHTCANIRALRLKPSSKICSEANDR